MASKKVLIDLNLNGNKVQNAVLEGCTCDTPLQESDVVNKVYVDGGISELQDSKQDAVYVLDFTLQDIYDVYYNGAQKQCLVRATLEAVQSGRQVVIKIDDYSENNGYIPVSSYIDDFLYLDFVYSNQSISVTIGDFNETTTSIDAGSVYIQTFITDTDNNYAEYYDLGFSAYQIFNNTEGILRINSIQPLFDNPNIIPFIYGNDPSTSLEYTKLPVEVQVDTYNNSVSIEFDFMSENFYIYGIKNTNTDSPTIDLSQQVHRKDIQLRTYITDFSIEDVIALANAEVEYIEIDGAGLEGACIQNCLIFTSNVRNDEYGTVPIVVSTQGTIEILHPTHGKIDVVWEGDRLTSATVKEENAVQKTGDVMTGTLTAPKFIGELEGNATSADVAKELSGHIEATEESFNFRASAGNKSIKDENARIEKIKGSSVVWNQKFPTNSRVLDKTSTLDVTMHDGVITANGNTGTSDSVKFGVFDANYEGVKYLFILQVISNIKALDGKYLRLFNRDYFKAFCEIKNGFAAFVYSNTSSEVNKGRFLGVETGKEYIVDNVTMYTAQIDLTQMFGAGNEPTTVEEFYERMPKGVDLNAYNEGEIINGNYNAIKTIGFNQFNNSKAEYGSLSENGDIVESSSYYTGLIKVLPSTDYYLKDVANGNNTISGAFYDSGMRCISPFIIPVLLNTQSNASGSITTPQNAAFMRVVTHSDYISTCCVNLIHSGIRNGEYEPYKEFTHDLSWIKKYFPNGMRSAGDARDEIRFNSTTQKWEAVQRVGVVDLGECSIYYSTEKNEFYFKLENSKRNTQYPYWDYVNQINSIGYKSARTHPEMTDMQICVNYLDSTKDYVYLKDSRYPDAITYKNAVKGQLLHYELAEPIVTEITDVVDMNYNVYDFGTEELLVVEDDSSASFLGEIVYQFNAVDRIRDNERNINVLNEDVKDLKETYIPKKPFSTDVLLANGETQLFNKEDRQALTTNIASIVSVDMGALANGTSVISLNQTGFNTLMSASTTKISAILNGVKYVFGNACKEIVNAGRIVYSQMFFASADTSWPFKMFKLEITQQGTSSQYLATATVQNIDMTVLTTIAE